MAVEALDRMDGVQRGRERAQPRTGWDGCVGVIEMTYERISSRAKEAAGVSSDLLVVAAERDELPRSSSLPVDKREKTPRLLTELSLLAHVFRYRL